MTTCLKAVMFTARYDAWTRCGNPIQHLEVQNTLLMPALDLGRE